MIPRLVYVHRFTEQQHLLHFRIQDQPHQFLCHPRHILPGFLTLNQVDLAQVPTLHIAL